MICTVASPVPGKLFTSLLPGYDNSPDYREMEPYVSDSQNLGVVPKECPFLEGSSKYLWEGTFTVRMFLPAMNFFWDSLLFTCFVRRFTRERIPLMMLPGSYHRIRIADRIFLQYHHNTIWSTHLMDLRWSCPHSHYSTWPELQITDIGRQGGLWTSKV